MYSGRKKYIKSPPTIKLLQSIVTLVNFEIETCHFYYSTLPIQDFFIVQYQLLTNYDKICCHSLNQQLYLLANKFRQAAIGRAKQFWIEEKSKIMWWWMKEINMREIATRLGNGMVAYCTCTVPKNDLFKLIT
jgi:hypothetical protein